MTTFKIQINAVPQELQGLYKKIASFEDNPNEVDTEKENEMFRKAALYEVDNINGINWESMGLKLNYKQEPSLGAKKGKALSSIGTFGILGAGIGSYVPLIGTVTGGLLGAMVGCFVDHYTPTNTVMQRQYIETQGKEFQAPEDYELENIKKSEKE